MGRIRIVLFLTIFISPQALFSQIADSFIYPLDGGWARALIKQGFGRASDDSLFKTDSGWFGKYPGYHLGYDISVVYSADDKSQKRYKQVLAPANGSIRFAQPLTDVGYVVVIEHQLPTGDPDGTAVCSVLYHLLQPSDGGISLQTGDGVNRGDLIGYVSPYEADTGGVSPHQHFGIRRGPYKTGIDSRTGRWFYPGYTVIRKDGIIQRDLKDTIHTQIISEWFNPYDFLQRHLPAQAFTPISSPTAAYLAATSVLPINVPDFTSINSVTNGTQTVSFSSPMEALTVPTSWATWNSPPNTETSTPRILYTEGAFAVTLTLANPATIFGFETEPNPFAVHTITATFMNGSTTIGIVTRTVNGYAGALLAAASSGLPITSVRISSDADFAIGQIRSGPK